MVDLSFLIILVILNCIYIFFFFYRKNVVHILLHDFSKVVILCLFSAKTFIENCISWAKYICKQIFSARDKKPLNTPIVLLGQMVQCGFIWTFTIPGLRYTGKSRNGLTCWNSLCQKGSVPYYHFRALKNSTYGRNV